MPTPLIIGPFDRPKRFQRYPAPPAGALLVARLGRKSFHVLIPPREAGFVQGMRLGVYYVVRRHSGLTEDTHYALTSDPEVEFTFKYSFTLQLTSATSDVCDKLKENAIDAVRYYSQHADPVLLFRARLRQRLNELARQHARPQIGELYDKVLGFQNGGCEVLQAPSGMQVRLEHFNVSTQPRGLGTAA